MSSMFRRIGRMISVLVIIGILSGYASFIPLMGTGITNKLVSEAQAQTTAPLLYQSNLQYNGAFKLEV